MKKQIIIILLLLIGWMSGSGQGNTGCYQIIGQLSGKTDLYSAELLDTVCSVVDIIQNNFMDRSSDSRNNIFNAYSFEFYPLSAYKNQDGNFESNVKDAFTEFNSLSPYYIGVAKVITDKIEYKIKLKLPNDGNFATIDEKVISNLEKELEDVGQAYYNIFKINAIGELAIFERFLARLNILTQEYSFENEDPGDGSEIINRQLMSNNYISQVNSFYVSLAGIPIHIPSGSRIRFAWGNVYSKSADGTKLQSAYAEGAVFDFWTGGSTYYPCCNANGDFVGYKKDCKKNSTLYIPEIKTDGLGSHTVIYASKLENCSYVHVAEYTYNSSYSDPSFSGAGPVRGRNDVASNFTTTKSYFNEPVLYSQNGIPLPIPWTLTLEGSNGQVLPYPCIDGTDIAKFNTMLAKGHSYFWIASDGKSHVATRLTDDILHIQSVANDGSDSHYYYHPATGWKILSTIPADYTTPLGKALMGFTLSVTKYSLFSSGFILGFAGPGLVGAGTLSTADILALETSVGIGSAAISYATSGDSKALIVDLAFTTIPLAGAGVVALKNMDEFKGVLKELHTSYISTLYKGSVHFQTYGKKINDIIVRIGSGSGDYYSYKEFSSYLKNTLKLSDETVFKLIDDFTSSSYSFFIKNPKLIKAWEEILNLKAHASLRTNTTFLDDFLGSSLGLRPEHTQQGPMIGKKIGHTFSKHGSHNTKQLLYQSVNGTVPNGQWLDDVAAEDFIARHLDQLGQGTRDIPLPASVRGIGRVFKNGDGQIIEATHIRLVPSGTGVDTAFPINETLVSLNPLGVYKP